MLEYTGERMVPEAADRYTFWAHIYRYRFALPFILGKRVLDIACGEGYGTAAMLKAGAASVVGVDVSPEACVHAAQRYGIETKVGNAEAIPLENQSVDTVVSFETIEHLQQPEVFLDECVRVLAPHGRIIISTPNSAISESDSHHNPFHLRELTEREFRSSLEMRFSDFQMFTQRPQTSTWSSLRALARDRAHVHGLPGFGRFQRLVQTLWCPEIIQERALNLARLDPVASICKPQTGWSHVANPFSIRPFNSLVKEEPVYFLAVASVRN